MSDLNARIDALEPDQAASILRAIAKARMRANPDATPSAETQPVSELSAVPEGEVAKLCLHLLADDPDERPKIEAMVEHPPAERFVEPGTFALGLGALVVLQAYIKFERGKDGKWSFKFEKKPLSDTLLGQVVAKLGTWLKG